MQDQVRGEAPLLHPRRPVGAAPRRDFKARPGGFTLLELVTVIAIVGILLGVALPSYRGYVQRVNRTEAVTALLEVAACQERVFATKGRFDTTQCPSTAVDHYEIRLEPPDDVSALAFVAWADPVGAQENDPCGSLGLDQTGLRMVSEEGASAQKCWHARR